jgi:hypothetical protein
MQIFRTPFDIKSVKDISTRNLIASRLSEIEPPDAIWVENFGSFFVVEPGDTFDSLQAAARWPLFSGEEESETVFFEWAYSHESLYELAYVISDSGQYIIVVIPMKTNINRAILSYCNKHATRSQNEEK